MAFYEEREKKKRMSVIYQMFNMYTRLIKKRGWDESNNIVKLIFWSSYVATHALWRQTMN